MSVRFSELIISKTTSNMTPFFWLWERDKFCAFTIRMRALAEEENLYLKMETGSFLNHFSKAKT